MKRKMVYLGLIAGIVALGTVTWTMTMRAGYESAEYKVIESDGDFEVREYPNLMLAATSAEMDLQGRDGSFMRLFRYISGENTRDRKIAMTTPVFMEGAAGNSNGSMGFVIPEETVVEGIPDPESKGVLIRQRDGGRFAVIRFSGRMDSMLAKQQEAKLRQWIRARGLEGETNVEAAGYDPPFTPGLLRRNEILIRLKQPDDESRTVQVPDA